MTSISGRQFTRLLERANRGDEAALEELTPIVYDELRARAHAQMRAQSPGHTLQTTALANEAWIRLVDREHVDWSDRGHFFALAATCIRSILVDHARKKGALKRGGGAGQRVAMEIAEHVAAPEFDEFLALDAALTRFAVIDARKARVMELRFFSGLENTQIAEALQVSLGTVERDLRLGRAWLAREMSRDTSDGLPGESPQGPR